LPTRPRSGSPGSRTKITAYIRPILREPGVQILAPETEAAIMWFREGNPFVERERSFRWRVETPRFCATSARFELAGAGRGAGRKPTLQCKLAREEGLEPGVGVVFHLGDKTGISGSSLTVQLTGEYAGNWVDWATGDHGDLIDLVRSVYGENFSLAVRHLEQTIGETTHRRGGRNPLKNRD